MSTLDKITQSSMSGIINSAEEAETILDHVMQYKLIEIDRRLADDPGDTVLSLFERLIYVEKHAIEHEDDLIELMSLPDRIMKDQMNRLPWIKLLSAVTLDTLFDVYEKRSKKGTDYDLLYDDAVYLLGRYAKFEVTETSTVGDALKRTRSERKKAWNPGEDLHDYAEKIHACYEIVKVILYDGLVDIYDVQTLCEEHLDLGSDIDIEADNEKIT